MAEAKDKEKAGAAAGDASPEKPEAKAAKPKAKAPAKKPAAKKTAAAKPAAKKAEKPAAEKAEKPAAKKTAKPAAKPAAKREKRTAAQGPILRIKQVRSGIGRPGKHRRTLRALGFRKHQQVVTLPDNPAIRGMVSQIRHLVSVESASQAD